jgi:phosphatidylserine decarboxylase
MRLAQEGYPYIIGFATIAVIAFAIGGIWIALIPFLFMLFMLYFFRDPERKTPEGKGLFVAPADGKVILIKEINENIGISIFMSPLNVHVNRSPCNGKVKTIKHNKGRFLAAYKDDASLKNENIEMVLETEYGDILVRQVAGYVARRAVCRKKEGDILRCGERYGIIKFSSRLDVYLPKQTEIKVRLGDRVKAGETIIGIIP